MCIPKPAAPTLPGKSTNGSIPISLFVMYYTTRLLKHRFVKIELGKRFTNKYISTSHQLRLGSYRLATDGDTSLSHFCLNSSE